MAFVSKDRSSWTSDLNVIYYLILFCRVHSTQYRYVVTLVCHVTDSCTDVAVAWQTSRATRLCTEYTVSFCHPYLAVNVSN